jgi:hypothetical protein
MELHVATNRPHLVGLFEQFTYDVPDVRLAPILLKNFVAHFAGNI